jgi:hypothetical protein
MPYVVECVTEKLDLTESRTLMTWKAVMSLATEVYPDGAQYFLALEKPHIAQPREVLAWRVALNRIKIMPRRELPFDIKEYEEDWFVNYEAIAQKLNTSVDKVSLMIRSSDKGLMTRAAEEVSNSILHSNQLKHEVALADRSRFKD